MLLTDIRDVLAFLRAKRSRKEPVFRHVRAVAEADYVPRDRRSFEWMRARLRERDFGRACERLDALESALRRRHYCDLPLPRKMTQNADASLTVFWEGAMVRCFRDGFFSMIGGTAGVKAKAVTPALVDLLAFQWRIQCPRH